MPDATEVVRREMLAEINAQPGSREALEAERGEIWNAQELGQDFEVLGFAAPLVVVRRRADGVRGSLFFQHSPRFYFLCGEPHKKCYVVSVVMWRPAANQGLEALDTEPNAT